MLKTSLSRPLCLLSTSSRSFHASRLLANAKLPSEKTGNPSPLDSDKEQAAATTSYDIDLVKKRVREWSERAALTVRDKADGFTATTKTNLSHLGSELNRVTGYEQIEALKRQVVEQEARINATRQAARDAKTAYQQAVVHRSNSQREVNDLLQRKSSWTDTDVSRFTALVREDHGFEQDEARAKATVDASDDAVEREFSELLRAILSRYHEEQVWSDKIRSASTYGQMAALALNMLVFVMAIIVVEPWKRKRLAQTFEAKMEEMSRSSTALVDQGMQGLAQQLDAQQQMWAERLAIPNRVVEPGPPAVLGGPDEANVIVDSTVALEPIPRELTIALAATAVVAGTLGWLAGAWFG